MELMMDGFQPVNAPLESLDLGWFIIDRYDRKQHANVVRGTAVTIPPKVFNVLKILAAGDGRSYVPYADLRSVFNGAASATVLTSQSLKAFEDILPEIFETVPETPLLERGGHAGVRLVRPTGEVPALKAGEFKAPAHASPARAAAALRPAPDLKPAQVPAAANGKIMHDFGYFHVEENPDARPAERYKFATRYRFLTQVQFDFVQYMNAHAGQWITRKTLAAHLFPGADRGEQPVYQMLKAFMPILGDVIGANNINQVFKIENGAGVCFARPDIPFAPVTATNAFAQARSDAAAVTAPEGTEKQTPALYYHPVYGPGYDLGTTTIPVGVSEMTLRRFMPVTMNDPRDQVEVKLGDKQVRSGYGKLDLDAYRAALETGARELRGSLEGKKYDGPEPMAISRVLKDSRSPVDMVPLLAAFSFYVPQVKDGSAGVHAHLEKSIVRSMVLAYPYLTQLQAQHHLQILQNAAIRIPADQVWPFESPAYYAAATAALEALVTGAKKKVVKLGAFATAVEGKKVISGGHKSFDVSGYLQRAVQRSALVAQ